ncbi:MAG: FixH family protein [Candidatus Sulfotelmatobacter sp.]
MRNRLSRQKLARRLAGFVCAATLFTVGCSRPVELPPFVEIEHEISPQPARVGPVTVTLKLADATGKALTGAHIAVEADMSHPGMNPLFAEAKEAEPGRYQAHLEFQMAGDWVILIHVTLPDGKKLERQIDVRGVQPGVQSGVQPGVQHN